MSLKLTLKNKVDLQCNFPILVNLRGENKVLWIISYLQRTTTAFEKS